MASTSSTRYLSAWVIAVTLLALSPGRAQTPSTPVAPNPVDSLLTESAQRLADGDYQGALSDASTALVLDPKNASAYEARGSIYIQQKLWDRAERDYISAYKLTPDPVYKFKLGEIKFLQKAYMDARPRFAALTGDPNLGQLATYKAFLCDLLGRHDAAAARDLNELDQTPDGPAHYYCHAAWDLYHSQRADANKLFKTADELYGDSTRNLYLESLAESRRFQLDTISFTTRAGATYTSVSVFLESAGLRVSTSTGWLTIPLDQLPDDLSAFPQNLREQIDRKRAVLGAAASTTTATFVTFTTSSGQAYHNVRWALVDSGLSVLTPDGWTTIPFKDLPTDLSTFPPELQQAITAERSAHAAGPLDLSIVSFTTRQGKTYSGIQAQPGPEGLRVLTPNGWGVVAYTDLPDDVSAFPPDWQKSIADQRRLHATAGPVEPGALSFITRQGKTYTNVHAELGREGVRVLTPDGWIAVAYLDLPDDLSAFPPSWQTDIKDRRIEAANDASAMQVVSFTTRHGVHYADVRASMEKSGLRLVTSNGLVAIPYNQLPTDLSPFPPSWRDAITAHTTETAQNKPASPQ